MKKIKIIVVLVIFTTVTFAQTVQSLIQEINTQNLDKTLNELSGETTTNLGGSIVTITTRKSSVAESDLTRNYIKEKLNSFGNIIVEEHNYPDAFLGKNIIATQKGEKNPDNIYIICAHFDAVTNFCADDNATGTSAVLEIARILSKYCIENTIIYAFWDEEELGLIGSKEYVKKIKLNGTDKNIWGL